MPDTERVTMSAREAAKYLGISYWLILEMVKRGQINAIHAGARVLFRKETIDNWIRNQEMQPIQPQTKEETELGKIRKVSV
jgi:excisionase family DNA binding protein